MGKLYEVIDDRLKEFIEAQRLFFVATAPSGPNGHVNVSPKGLDTFRILGPREVAYIDFVGSGVETIAHLRENGRIVLMFCAFEGSPNIVRLHGHGRVLEPHDDAFSDWTSGLPSEPQVRSVIVVDIERISDSCGFGVPLFEYKGERNQLSAWSKKKGPAKVLDYQKSKNAESIDRLPGLRWVKP